MSTRATTSRRAPDGFLPHIKKEPTGRPPHMPNPVVRRVVRTLAAHGAPQHAICYAVGVSAKTLRRHYASELEVGAAEANAKVAAALFRAALGNGPEAVTAAIFWLKCRAGWYAPPMPRPRRRRRA